MSKILNQKSTKKLVVFGGADVHDVQGSSKGGFDVDTTNKIKGLGLNVQVSKVLSIRVIVIIYIVLQLYIIGGIKGGRTLDALTSGALSIENFKVFSSEVGSDVAWTGLDVTPILGQKRQKPKNVLQLFMVLAKTPKMGAKNG